MLKQTLRRWGHEVCSAANGVQALEVNKDRRIHVQDFVENDRTTKRHYEIFPDSGFYREHGREATKETPSAALDDAPLTTSVIRRPLSASGCGSAP